MPSILWYDLETWDNKPESTRIAQFAAQRTDLNFQPIGEPIVYYVRPARDFIASPHAILVHGLLPSMLGNADELDGIPIITELQLLKKIIDEVSVPQTIVAGYNNLRFDNIVLRFSFYRNGLEPYLLDFGSDTCWDLIDVVRATHALRPEGVIWPQNIQQVTSFKLEDLAKANSLTQLKAHDALSDVQATIELAKKIKQAQLKLFDYFFEHRSSDKVMELLGLKKQADFLQGVKPPMLVHISGMVSADKRRAEVIVPIAVCDGRKNYVIAVDLSCNPDQWLDLDIESLSQQVFGKKEEGEKQDFKRIRILAIRSKFCPALAPVSVLSDELWNEISGGQQQCLDNYQKVLSNLPQITQKLVDLFATDYKKELKDTDLALYSGGFYSYKDKGQLQQFHQADWKQVDWSQWNFDHPNLTEICFRTQGRNSLSTLNQEDKKRWLRHCLQSWQEANNTNYCYQQCLQDIESLLEQDITDTSRDILIHYGNWVEDQYAELQQLSS